VIMEVIYYAGGLLVLAGVFFSLLAAVGLLRLPDLYTRLHAASKAGVVGAGLVLLAIALTSLEGAVAFRAVVGVLFLILTTPVSAHLLARAAYLTGLKPDPTTLVNEMVLEEDNMR